MSIRKNTLFTVPLYCIAAGFISFYLIVYGVGRFAIVTLPDGTFASDENKVLLIYGLLLAATLAIGPLLFRRLTKKEIAVSATVMAAFQLILILLQTIVSPTGRLALTFSYLSRPGEWASFIPLALYRLTGRDLLSAIPGALAPYIFVLFGKKRLDQ